MTAKKPPGPRISKKVKAAIEALASQSCKTQREAAAKAGLSHEHLCRELKKPHVAAFVEQRTRALLAAGQLRASARVMELVDGKSEHVSLDASRLVLGINSIAPPAHPGLQVDVNLSPGYIIDLSGSARASLTAQPAVPVSPTLAPADDPDGLKDRKAFIGGPDIISHRNELPFYSRRRETL